MSAVPSPEKNVLGGPLLACGYDPLTGFFRDGCCATRGAEGVAHLVCVKVTEEFLEFSRAQATISPRRARKCVSMASSRAIAGACTCCAGSRLGRRAGRPRSCSRPRTRTCCSWCPCARSSATRSICMKRAGESGQNGRHHRRGSGRAHGGGGCERRRRASRCLRRHALGRAQIPDGRQGRAEPHALTNRRRLFSRYGARRAYLAPLLAAFGPEALRAWARGLGVDTFVGSSGRVFPSGMKAAPLLRAWLHRLRARACAPHAPSLVRLGRGWGAALRDAAGRARRARRRRGAGAGRRQLGAAGFRRRLGAVACRARRARGATAAGELRLRRRLERTLSRALRRPARSSRWSCA